MSRVVVLHDNLIAPTFAVASEDRDTPQAFQIHQRDASSEADTFSRYRRNRQKPNSAPIHTLRNNAAAAWKDDSRHYYVFSLRYFGPLR